jgi:HD superfamily phosphohydrolase
MDYCQRDLISCGLPIALGDHFLDYLSVTRDDEGLLEDHRRLVVNLDKGGMPRPDVESEIVSLLTHRYELAERVYFHHAKNSASVMIGRAVQEAGWAAGVHGGVNLDRNFLWLSDEMLLAALADPAIADALALRSAAEHDGDRRLASELAKGVRTRRLYKMAFLATWEDNPHAVGRITKEHGGDPVKRRQFEDGLADLAALRRGHVLVHIPGQQMMRKDADVRVRTGQGEVVKLHEWDRSHSKRLAALNEAHERLWRVMVFVHPDDEAAIPVVRAAAQDEFRSASRLVPRDDVSEYSRALFADLTTRWRLAVEDAEALQHAAYVRSEGRRAAERAILGAVRLQRRLSGQPQLRRR